MVCQLFVSHVSVNVSVICYCVMSLLTSLRCLLVCQLSVRVCLLVCQLSTGVSTVWWRVPVGMSRCESQLHVDEPCMFAGGTDSSMY